MLYWYDVFIESDRLGENLAKNGECASEAQDDKEKNSIAFLLHVKKKQKTF